VEQTKAMEEKSSLGGPSGETEAAKQHRQELLQKLGDSIGRTAIAYFTSQIHPVVIDAVDADMLEEALRQSDLRRGLCLILDTPGGDGISAERIVRICRIYSKNKFDVFIARRAKSAGTIIALGADKIFMGETSALGRIDPQIVAKEKNGTQSVVPAHVVVKSFDYLVSKTKASVENKEVYLQQLGNYNAKEIELIRRQMKMTEDIALRCLKQGMWADMSEREIKRKIAPFVTPVTTKAHTRDIFFDEARNTGLNVELVRHDTALWNIVCDYYILAWDFVTGKYCKLIESGDSHFSLPWHGK
jgi:ClpP class serine protease